jgi:hypothetical protein
MLKRAIQLCISTNCISEVSRTKPVYSGTVTRKPSTEPTMASMRASCAFLSSPVASTSIPNRIGNQIATLITGNPKNMLSSLYFLAAIALFDEIVIAASFARSATRTRR